MFRKAKLKAIGRRLLRKYPDRLRAEFGDLFLVGGGYLFTTTDSRYTPMLDSPETLLLQSLATEDRYYLTRYIRGRLERKERWGYVKNTTKSWFDRRFKRDENLENCYKYLK